MVSCPTSVKHILDEDYVPSSWAPQDAVTVAFYQGVVARSCRTCHVAMIEGLNFDHYSNLTGIGSRLPDGIGAIAVTVCVSAPQASIMHDRMPQLAGHL